MTGSAKVYRFLIMVRHSLLARVLLGIFAVLSGTSYNIHAITDDQVAYLETYGWIVGQKGIAQLGLNKDELEAFVIKRKEALPDAWY